MSIEIAQVKKEIGKNLFKLALKWSINPSNITKKSMREQVKNLKNRKQKIHGSKSIETAFLATLGVVETIYENRKNKIKHKYNPYNQSDLANINRNKARLAFWNYPIEERLTYFKKDKEKKRVDTVKQKLKSVISYFHSCYRYDELAEMIVLQNSEHTLKVTQDEKLDWNYYSRSTKYPKKLTYTYFTFDESYVDSVLDKGIACLDGLITLSATEVEANVYKATWIEQSRGYSLKEISGFIAVKDGVAFHGKTLKSAKSGLNRKLKEALSNDLVNTLLTNETLAGRIIEKYGHLPVTKQDAKKSGACVAGTRSWCYRVGIDYDNTDSVTLKTVYEAQKTAPMPEIERILTQALKTA